MAERNQQVMDMVASELERNPEATLDELYERAVEIDSSVSELSKRQFNGRFPLQVKRQRAAGRPRKKRASPRKGRKTASSRQSDATGTTRRKRAGSEGGVNREQLRALFMEFATEVAAAETPKDIFRVIGTVDAYVDRATKLASR